MYNKRVWRDRLQPMVIRRDPFCMSGVICDPDNIGRRAPSTHADHIIPVAERPDLAWDIDNLQGLCAACHSHKTATEDSTFAKKKAA
jgi:5-methylcytosine-specific restriction enzyme A